MIYHLLKLQCRIALRFFFRNWHARFEAPIPSAPTIFLANHPNTFLDAILIACSTENKIWFMARGEVFKSKWSAWALSGLGLIPIFRFRDGHGSLRKNEDIINRCAKLLNSGQSILLFPEGDNSLEGKLLPLQKGFIKMAEAALKQHPDVDLQIVPAGIRYSSNNKGFGGDALVNFGRPMPYSTLAKEKTPEQILDATWQMMNELIHPIATPVQSAPSLLAQLNRPYFLVNGFVLKILVRFAASFIKEEAMKNSVKYAVGMFLALPVYSLQSIIVFALTHSWPISLLYMASLPVSMRIYLLSKNL